MLGSPDEGSSLLYVHGNLVALDAALAATQKTASRRAVDRRRSRRPRPTARRDRSSTHELEATRIVRGNTDRYVTTGELSDAVPSLDALRTPEESRTLVDMITAHAWTRGCVTTAGGYDWLADLPMEIRVVLPDDTRALPAHASPGSDDGPGATADMTDEELESSRLDLCRRRPGLRLSPPPPRSTGPSTRPGSSTSAASACPYPPNPQPCGHCSTPPMLATG